MTLHFPAEGKAGDKSQLVCMTLAAQHRHWPALAGSAAAFLILKMLAILFGAGLSHWVPEQILAAFALTQAFV